VGLASHQDTLVEQGHVWYHIYVFYKDFTLWLFRHFIIVPVKRKHWHFTTVPLGIEW